MIYLNNNSTLKDIVGVYVNVNNSIKTVKEIWYNDGGTLYKIWPDYAYNGTNFVGELTGGFENLPSGIYYDNQNRTYTAFNDGNDITSGSLYVSSFNSYQNGGLVTPAICISVRSIDFSKYSSIRIKGYWSAWANTINGQGITVQYQPTIRMSATTISGTTITRYGTTASASCGDWSWTSKYYESDQGSSGNKSFDVTLDISQIVKNSAKMELYVTPGAYESSESKAQSNASFHIQRIELV